MLQRLSVLALLVLFAAPTVSSAQFKQGDWDLTLFGSGANDQDFTTFNVSVAGSLGYLLTDQLEIGARPAVVISDGGSEYVWNLGAFADFHFDLGAWQPFLGGSIGYQFGGGDIEDGWTAGPEGGVKYFVNSTTYVFGSMSYLFNLNDGFDSGGFFYGLGIGFKF